MGTQLTIVTQDRTTKSNEGSTPPNGIEAGKRTTESNQGSNPSIRNPKSEIQNPNLNNLNPNSVFTKVM